MSEISIITCSYNKHKYILDAINSVLNQTFSDFEYLVLENSDDKKTRKIVHSIIDSRVKIIDKDYTKEERNKEYIESVLKNEYFPKLKGKYIMVLADDDILEPTCFEEHIKDFKTDNNHMANYHACRLTYIYSDTPDSIQPAKIIFGPNRRTDRIDGGSVMINKKVLDKIFYPYFRAGWRNAHISDLIFLRRLSHEFTIYPIDKILHTKRVTNISTHMYINKKGKPQFFRLKAGGKHPTLDLGE